LRNRRHAFSLEPGTVDAEKKNVPVAVSKVVELLISGQGVHDPCRGAALDII
jgi:hypothetical protein